MELIAVVMGAATSQKRNASCKQLLDYGFANYALFTPDLADTPEIPVVLGAEASVPVRLSESAALLIDKGQRSGITTETALEESTPAPVSRGQRLGTLRVKAGDQLLSEIPLVAAEGIPRLTWGELFCKVLARVAMAKMR
jgi:D-alanyl-D-alanine carboxypeptidase (penicillin-binding protein 5/6)